MPKTTPMVESPMPGGNPGDITAWAAQQAVDAARALPEGLTISALSVDVSVLLSETQGQSWRTGIGLVGTPVSLALERRHTNTVDRAVRLKVDVVRVPQAANRAPSTDQS